MALSQSRTGLAFFSAVLGTISGGQIIT